MCAKLKDQGGSYFRKGDQLVAKPGGRREPCIFEYLEEIYYDWRVGK